MAWPVVVFGVRKDPVGGIRPDWAGVEWVPQVVSCGAPLVEIVVRCVDGCQRYSSFFGDNFDPFSGVVEFGLVGFRAPDKVQVYGLVR